MAPLRDGVGDCGLPRSRQAAEPKHASVWHRLLQHLRASIFPVVRVGREPLVGRLQCFCASVLLTRGSFTGTIEWSEPRKSRKRDSCANMFMRAGTRECLFDLQSAAFLCRVIDKCNYMADDVPRTWEAISSLIPRTPASMCSCTPSKPSLTTVDNSWKNTS